MAAKPDFPCSVKSAGAVEEERLNKCAVSVTSFELCAESLSHKYNLTITMANGLWYCAGRCDVRERVVVHNECWRVLPLVGPSGGQTEGYVQTDAGAAAAGWEMPPPHRHGAGQREAKAHRLHQQEWRLHQPAGAGEREVSSGWLDKSTCFLLDCLLWHEKSSTVSNIEEKS